jgi:hypothetical protein
MFERAARDIASGTEFTVVLDVVRQVLLDLAADTVTGRDQ